MKNLKKFNKFINENFDGDDNLSKKDVIKNIFYNF